LVDAVLEDLVLDFLEWLATRTRTYKDAMNAWRTTCPNLPVWEEAIDRGLVERGMGNGSSLVRISPQGAKFLRQRRSLRVEESMEKAT